MENIVLYRVKNLQKKYGKIRIQIYVVVVVYHVTIVAIGRTCVVEEILAFWYQAAFYALQGVQLFETMQTRLLRQNYSIMYKYVYVTCINIYMFSMEIAYELLVLLICKKKMVLIFQSNERFNSRNTLLIFLQLLQILKCDF